MHPFSHKGCLLCKRWLVNDNAKRDFDGILELWKDCWRRITERRTYEWRTAYTLWAALAGFIVLVLTKPPSPLQSLPKNWLVFWMFIFSIILVSLHVVWLFYFYYAHKTDHEMAFEYERLLREYVDGSLSARIEAVLQKESRSGTLVAMSIAHIFVTLALLGILALVLWGLEPAAIRSVPLSPYTILIWL